MLVPISSIQPLGGIQRITRMCRSGKAPRFVDIPAKSNNDDALAMLRHAKIGGIHLLKHHPVSQPMLPASRMMFLEAGQMILPGSLPDNVRILELQKDVLKIFGK